MSGPDAHYKKNIKTTFCPRNWDVHSLFLFCFHLYFGKRKITKTNQKWRREKEKRGRHVDLVTDLSVRPLLFILCPQFEMLYIEVLYTVKHKIGATSGSHSPYQQDLFQYAKEAFRVTPEDHARLLAKATEEKVLRSLSLSRKQKFSQITKFIKSTTLIFKDIASQNSVVIYFIVNLGHRKV